MTQTIDNKNIKENFEKNRKIVLDYIGEEDNKKKTESPKPVKHSKGFKPEEQSRPNENNANEEDRAKVKELLGLNEAKNEQNLKDVAPAQMVEEKKIVSSKVPVKELKVEKNINKKVKRSVSVEKAKRQKKKKEIIESTKRVQNLKEKIKKERVSLKDGAKKSLNFNIYKRLVLVSVMIGLALLFSFYLLYSILVLNLNNRFLNSMSAYLPVPAVISKFGILDYYSAEEIKNMSRGNNYQENVATVLVLRNIAKKNNIEYGNDVQLLKNILIDKQIMNVDELEKFLKERISDIRVLFLN